MKKFNVVMMGLVMTGVLCSTAQAAIEWTGMGRMYHQRWSFGDGDDAANMHREKMDFYLNAEAPLSHNVMAQVRFIYYTDDLRDKVAPLRFNKANLTWNYGEGNFIKFGKFSVIDKNVGDHMRSYIDNRLGLAWRHTMDIGPGMVFLGASRFALGDTADAEMTDQTMYYTPQLGYEMMMGDFKIMVGGTYHMYTSLSRNDFTRYETVQRLEVNEEGDDADVVEDQELVGGYVNLGYNGRDEDDFNYDYAGIEFFARVSGMIGELGWHAKFAMFSNGEAPDSAADEDKSVTFMGFGLDWRKVSVMVEMNDMGTYAVNRAIAETDWCGYKPMDNTESTCNAMRLTASYKLSDNLMPSLEFIQSERNNEYMPEDERETEDFMMTRLSLNFMF